MRFVLQLGLISALIMISGCQQHASAGQLKNVGLLLPMTINEEVWYSQGYEGVLDIASTFDVDVFYKENMKNRKEVKAAIEEFKKQDVNIIFGHGNIYADMFMELMEAYPRIHFVSFNGEVQGENITSLHFEGKAMGFFGGMVASNMSDHQSVGVIAAYPWQPEVDGFIEGAVYQNRNISVRYEFVQSWNDTEKALSILDGMLEDGVDVIYPAGDGYNIAVIEEVKNEGLYAIGYVSDQADLGKRTILTSTVQHVDKLYSLVAKQFNNGELETGNLYFDFDDGVISMGTFSSEVPEPFVEEVKAEVQKYVETEKLPYEREE
jgi:transcriptional activator of comK gene